MKEAPVVNHNWYLLKKAKKATGANKTTPGKTYEPKKK